MLSVLVSMVVLFFGQQLPSGLSGDVKDMNGNVQGSYEVGEVTNSGVTVHTFSTTTARTQTCTASTPAMAATTDRGASCGPVVRGPSSTTACRWSSGTTTATTVGSTRSTRHRWQRSGTSTDGRSQ